MIEVANVALPLDAFVEGGAACVAGKEGAAGASFGPRFEKAARRALAKRLSLAPGEIRQIGLLRRSVDARKKRDVHFVCTLAVGLAGGEAEARVLAAGISGVRPYAPYEPLVIPDLSAQASASGYCRPIVVGAGPAGLFAALYLARAGLAPLLVERGAAVEERVAKTRAFAEGGPLDLQTNIQFGEGGAGTFSDGKLTTNIKSPFAAHVLRWFVDAGAPEEILWEAKPHIGTDRLIGVVRTLREEIVRAGGEVRFDTRLAGVRFEGGRLAYAQLVSGAMGKREEVPASHVVLACGHSARDTFQMLSEAGVVLEPKPFSVGVRIEHAQRMIDQAQYGGAAGHPALGAADYKLAVHLGEGEKRGVYTFCMCPGGEVVAAASEEGGVVVNGMSRYARDGNNANSALLVGVDPKDFAARPPCDGERSAGAEGVVAVQRADAAALGGASPSVSGGEESKRERASNAAVPDRCDASEAPVHPLAGIAFQRAIEHAAYAMGAREGHPYAAPAQTVGDFLAKRPSAGPASVAPTYPRGVVWGSLRECLPAFVADALAEALPQLERLLHGFASPDAVMTGVETRSSSPVRIVRGEGLQAQLARASEDSASQLRKSDAPPPTDGASTRAMSADVPCSEAPHATGLYPCGEGAGYAGGIMSAACDGLRVAEALVRDIAEEMQNAR